MGLARLRALALPLVLACASLPGVAGAASASNPLARIIAQQGGGYLCFHRAYDAAHMHRHRGQLTTSVQLSLDAGKDRAGQTVWLKLQLHQQGRSSPVAASCEWSAKANENTSGQRLIAAYPRDDGFACIAMYDNQAAIEAGTLMFDLAPDGRTATVYFDEEGIDPWGTLPERTVHDDKTGAAKVVPGGPSLKLGREERVFRLTRVEPAACRALEQAIDLSKD